MKRFQFILMSLMMLMLCAGCSTPITGKIVDAETGIPVEGAILLVEWSKTHGFGNTYSAAVKAVEVFSDKDGIVKIPGYNDPFAEKPDITIYKTGYVAWNNHWIFIDSRSLADRTDFSWKDGYVFRLSQFKPEYTHDAHTLFIDKCIGTRLDEQKKQIRKAIRNEELEASKEVNERLKIWREKKLDN